jgi:hypothetical protein
LNPILSPPQTVSTEAAQVVFDEMTIIRSSYTSNSLDGSGGGDGALFDTVYQALLSMNDFCTYLPLLCKLHNQCFSLSLKAKKTFSIDFQVNKIQEACRAF